MPVLYSPPIEPVLPKDTKGKNSDYAHVQAQFCAAVRTKLGEQRTEITSRNQKINLRDQYVYGDELEKALDIPIGHDKTSVNWLRRTVEIQATQFMGRPFQITSTSDTKDSSVSDQTEAERIRIENKKEKEYAELRKNAIDAIIRDNGGHALFMTGAESASATGTFIVKAWYDEEDKMYRLSPIEAVENTYVVWSRDDFRSFDAFAFVQQITKSEAMEHYNVPADTPTSMLGMPLDYIDASTVQTFYSNQPMVTVLEYTGILPGWSVEKGRVVKVDYGKEKEFNAVIVGATVYRATEEKHKIPKHYIFPNKRQRRRPWGESDISDHAIDINLTYIETLSDWRTVASKVNFPKFKGFNFGEDTQMPKYKSRAVQIIPLGEGQDITPLAQGDSNAIDFKQQLDELKEQFVRETGISRVLFDDPSVTLNSNQALLTSMKPTSDIAEKKKQLWGPIIAQMFEDALETVAHYDDSVKPLVKDANYSLRVQWPSVMQKEDPIYQQMLLNRFNAGTMSVQSYLEAQSETKEEIDRIRDEMQDPVTAAVLGRQLPLLAEQTIAPPQPTKEQPKVSVSLRGDLTPMQEAEIAAQNGFNSAGEMGPQGSQGLAAYENADNAGFIEGNAFKGGTAKTKTKGQENANTQPSPVATQANNTPGAGVVSQPGSGATPVSAQGSLNQQNQRNGA